MVCMVIWSTRASIVSFAPARGVAQLSDGVLTIPPGSDGTHRSPSESVAILAQGDRARYGSHPPLSDEVRVHAHSSAVVRYGGIVIYVDDVSAFPSIVDMVVSRTTGGGRSDTTPVALEAYEGAMAAARQRGFGNTVAQITSQLKNAGFLSLARRFRAASRSRGAAAHPDLSLAAEIVALQHGAHPDPAERSCSDDAQDYTSIAGPCGDGLGEPGSHCDTEPPRPAFDPADLQDYRRLRQRRRRHEPQVVDSAAPHAADPVALQIVSLRIDL